MFRVLFRELHCSVAVFLPRGNVLRAAPRTIEEYEQSRSEPSGETGDVVRIALVGDPNVGKSTIINKLVNVDLCPVSSKAHTTRRDDKVIFTNEGLQMIFVDTPGVINKRHAKKHKLPQDMLEAPVSAVENSIDVLGVVIDANDHFRRDYFTREIKELLERHRTMNPSASSILILNKVDLLKSKRKLLGCIDTLTGGVVGDKRHVKRVDDRPLTLKEKIWAREERRLSGEPEPESDIVDAEGVREMKPQTIPHLKGSYRPRTESWKHFEKVFLVSAKEEQGIDDIQEFIKSKRQQAIFQYRPDLVIDKNPHELTREIVREKLLDFLRDEVPHAIGVLIREWRLEPSGSLHIVVVLQCQNDRHSGQVLGSEGKRLKKITEHARQKLCNIFKCDVALWIVIEKQEKEDRRVW